MADDITPDETPTPETPPLKYPDVKFPSLEIRCKYLEALRLGLTNDKAAEACGYAASTVRKWIANWPEFKAQVDAARSQGKISLLEDLQAAGKKDWRAAAWLLTHHFPQEYGKVDRYTLEDIKTIVRRISDRLQAKFAGSEFPQGLELVREAINEAMESFD